MKVPAFLSIMCCALLLPSVAGAGPEQDGDVYVYSPVGKRDPFRSPHRLLPDEKKRQRTELEQYDLDQLKLTAVISRIGQPRALVVTPDGRGHVVRIGMLIGPNEGRITAIRPVQIEVTERYRDALQRLVKNSVNLELQSGDVSKGRRKSR